MNTVLQNTFNTILAAKKSMDTMVPDLLRTLADTSIDLDDRWSIYVQAVEQNVIVNEENYGDGYIDLLFGNGNGSPYDDFHMEKYQSATYPEIIERIEEKREEDRDTWNERFHDIPQENIAAWKEEVLRNCYSGFKYDW